MTFLQKILLPDGLPHDIYAETNPYQLIMEPWNAITSLFFLLPVLYWILKLKGKYKDYKIIVFSLPLLAMNGIGSAIFHAFHISSFFLFLDILPVLILMSVLIVYFWQEILKSWWASVGLLCIVILSQVLLMYFFNPPFSINLGYLMRGTALFLTFVIILKKINFRYAKEIIVGISFFIVALLFRTFDKEVTPYFSMGSHFLWHICTTVGVFFVSKFVYHYINIKKNYSATKSKMSSLGP
jgi:hemolysin III